MKLSAAALFFDDEALACRKRGDALGLCGEKFVDRLGSPGHDSKTAS